MVSRRRGLDDFGPAAGLQAGQQERRFHLSARDRQLVSYAVERPADYVQRGPIAPFLPLDPSPHPAQGLDHSTHRAASDGGVSGQRSLDPAPRHGAEKQPDRRS
jgi:hypothetical protein